MQNSESPPLGVPLEAAGRAPFGVAGIPAAFGKGPALIEQSIGVLINSIHFHHMIARYQHVSHMTVHIANRHAARGLVVISEVGAAGGLNPFNEVLVDAALTQHDEARRPANS